MTNIKTIREKLNMTQSALAKELNIDRSIVANWETGRSLPRADKLPQLAKALHCTIDDLFTESKTA